MPTATHPTKGQTAQVGRHEAAALAKLGWIITNTEPAAVEPDDTEPAAVEPEDTEPADVEPEDTDPAAVEPEDTEPAAVVVRPVRRGRKG